MCPATVQMQQPTAQATILKPELPTALCHVLMVSWMAQINLATAPPRATTVPPPRSMVQQTMEPYHVWGAC